VNRHPEYTADYVTPYVTTWVSALGHLAGRDGVRMLEVGSYEGGSALWFCDHVLTGRGARITCIDDFPDGARERRFDRNTAPYGDRIEKVKSLSVTALHALWSLPTTGDGPQRPSFDAAYIDGSHKAADVALDALAAWSMLSPGGVMILDDYHWGQGRPVQDRPVFGIEVLAASLRDATPLHAGLQVVLRRG